MDFHQLIAKMQQLDQPAVEDAPAEACGDMPPMDMPNMPSKAEEPPPSMSVNLNAQGLDNIEELLQLIMKVNPDAAKDGAPSMGMPSLPPLKMLPHDEPDGDEMPMPMKLGMDKDKEEAFGNSMQDSEPETMDVDAVMHDGDDLHKKKDMFKAAAGGDNPMAAEGTDLRAQIRAELLRRLEEAKGAK